MSTKKNSVVMQDLAYRDSRSFRAMVEGRGDGREKTYKLYAGLRRIGGGSDPLECVKGYEQMVNNSLRMMLLKQLMAVLNILFHVAGVAGMFVLLNKLFG